MLTTLPSSYGSISYASKLLYKSAAPRFPPSAHSRKTRRTFPLHSSSSFLLTQSHTFQLNPDDFETIRPFPVAPSWKAQFTIDIATSKDAALEHALERHRNFDLYMRDDSFTRHLHLGSSTDHTVFESEVTGAILALSSLPSLPHVKRVFLGIDNQSAMRALHRHRQQPGQYLLLAFHEELEKLQSRVPRLQLHIGWTPGHVDFPPNERVDNEAKLAAQNDNKPHPNTPPLLLSPLPRSIAATKAEFLSKTTTLWTTMWKASPRYQKYRRIDKGATVNSIHKPLMNLSRRNSSLIVQLRTAAVALNSWLFKINRANSARNANVEKTCHITSSHAHSTTNNGPTCAPHSIYITTIQPNSNPYYLSYFESFPDITPLPPISPNAPITITILPHNTYATKKTANHHLTLQIPRRSSLAPHTGVRVKVAPHSHERTSQGRSALDREYESSSLRTRTRPRSSRSRPARPVCPALCPDQGPHTLDSLQTVVVTCTIAAARLAHDN
ncbi:hypothetical protein R3P38DRAFT_3228807 [Favolaschia claudopus]|uniref:RNase H type-1 domain-containing protein n=1 Tax=Favolaschia claudopus TaxID=2862362 RepID=A0AAV9ZPX0_9AGAR